MKVALFTDTYMPEVNGVARTLGRWVNYLEMNQIDYKVFTPSNQSADITAEKGRIERFPSIPFFLYPDCRMAFPNPAHINKLVHDFQPTLIHVATPFNMGLCGRYFAHKLNVPLMASYHTHFDEYLSKYNLGWSVPLQWVYMRWFHSKCLRTFVPSYSTKKKLENKGLQHLDIWGRGVDTTKFRPRTNRSEILRDFGVNPDRFTLLYVGRIAAEKGIEVLLQAYDLLAPQMKENTQLLFAGGGPLFLELKNKHRHPSIRFFGFVEGEALSKLYASADVFVFPSITETFGNVVIEAMASGIPVIGAAAGGVGDIITDHITGLLCPPGDAAAFAHAIEKLYHDADLRGRLTIAGLQHAQKQSWEAINSRMLEHYYNLERSLRTDGAITLNP